MAPGGHIARRVPAAQVLGGVVHFSSASPAPGVVQHVNGNGLIIGRATGAPPIDGNKPAVSDPALQAVSPLLTQAGVAATVSPHIQRDVWFKLWGNMPMNPVSALTGAACYRVLPRATACWTTHWCARSSVP